MADAHYAARRAIRSSSRLVATMLSCAIISLISAAASLSDTGTTGSISQRGTAVPIRVTGDRDYPPYCYLDNGLPSGFDIDIIRAIATAIGLDLEIELKPWGEARRSLESGRADMIPGMARIPSRENDFEFTTPTKHLSFDLFVKRSSRIRSIEDARGRSIFVQRAGVMYDLIRQDGIFTNLVPVTDAPEAIRLLAAGECDGAIVNRVQGHYLIQRDKIPNLKSLNADFPTIPYCFAVRKGETELVSVLNEGLNIIRAEGTYDEIYDKWFGVYERTTYGDTIRILIVSVGTVLLCSILLAGINWSLRRKVQRRTGELRKVIDLIPHAIFARDRNGTYILANQALADSMGLSVDSIVGERHTELYPGDVHTEEYIREDLQVLDTGQSLFIPETDYIDRAGKRRFLQVTKIPFQQDERGKAGSVLCVAVDITPLKEAEEEVRANRERLEITLNSIGDGVIAVDSDGTVIWINPVAVKMLGMAVGEVVGKALADSVHGSTAEGDPQDFHEIIKKALQSDERAGLAYHLILTARDASQRDISLKWSPILRGKHARNGLVLVLRDVTDEILLNKRLNDTQKMESIGRLAGGVAHDFNNLLSGIIGYSELLNISLSGNEECRAYLKGIFEASERARELVQQLLAFSRRQPREIQPVNIHTVIGHVTSLLQHTLDRRITISRHLNAVATVVMGDRSLIQNALLNLGVNARDAMPSGGSLSISTRNHNMSESECGRFPYAIKPGPFIEIKVVDTGIGMDRETMNHIFEPFFTTKGQSGGTGLGLAAVYGTVKDHGGYISVSSRPCQGAEFTLGLPVSEAAIMDEDPMAAAADERGSGCILLVDDEPLVIHTMEAILKSLGYHTLSAVNGREALSVYAANRDRIDLVILDMIMPELNGEQTFHELRKMNPAVRVIISSGYLQEHNIPDLLDMGILGVLQKPFRKSDLARRVSYVLRFTEDV